MLPLHDRLRHGGEQAKFLNHNISLLLLPASSGLAPGESAALRAVVHPLQEGPLDFRSIFIVDAESGEIFTTSCGYTVLIRET